MNSNPPTPQAAARDVGAAPDAREADDFRNPFSPPGWLLLGCGLALAVAASAAWVDLPLTIWMSRSVSAGVNHAFELIGKLGETGRYVSVALAVYAIGLLGLARGWRNRVSIGYESMARGSLLMLSTLAVGGLAVLALKRSVARARPEIFFEKGFYGLGEMFSRAHSFNSFPSSHTYGAFAVAVVLGILAPRWRWVFWGLATLVAISRVVNLDHYLSDVMAAAGIAVFVGYALAPRVLNSRYRWPLRAPWRWWAKSAASGSKGVS